MDTNSHASATRTVVDRVVLGRRIAQRRQAIRMSQREFALAAGLGADRLAKLEVGKVVHPRFEEVADIADALQVSLEELAYEAPATGDAEKGTV